MVRYKRPEQVISLTRNRTAEWSQRPEDWTVDEWDRRGGINARASSQGTIINICPGTVLHKGGAPEQTIAIAKRIPTAIWIPGHPTLRIDGECVAFSES